MSIPPYRAVLFDLDGTLVDSLRDIAESMNQVLTEYGFPVHPVTAYNQFVGDGMDTLARRVLPPGCAEEPKLRETVVKRMKRVYADRWHLNSRLYPGIEELIAALAGTGLRIGVLSNKPDEFTTVMVEHFFPYTPWDILRGALPGVPVKPAPDAALAIAREWDLEPESIVYVGDTSTDVLTAVNAGMPCVGVTWGFRDRGELEAHGARWIVDQAADILPILRGEG